MNAPNAPKAPKAGDARNARAVAAAAVALAVFLALCLYQLDLPGLHYDEAREAGLPALQMLRAEPVEAQRDAVVHLFGRDVPLMVQDYIGALQAFLALPFLVALGPTVQALRLMPVAMAALGLLLTGALAWRLYGPRGAALALLALAVQPSFVFWSRQGVFVTSITGTIAVALVYLVVVGAERRQARYFVAAAALAGLGIYAKLLFVWLLGALAALAVAWLLATRAWRGLQRAQALPLAGAGAACAAAGALALAPLILYNVRTGGTLATLGANLSHSYYGVNNLALIPNLSVRLVQLREMLDGSHLWYLGATLTSAFAPWAYGAAAVLTLGVAAWAARPRGRALLLVPAVAAVAGVAAVDRLPAGVAAWTFIAGIAGLLAFVATEGAPAVRLRLAPLGGLALMVLESCFTVSDLFVTHFALLAPLAPLVLAAAVFPRAATPEGAGGRRAALLAAAVPLLLAGLLLPGDLWSDLQYHVALARTGGLSTHSDAIYRLAAMLEARPGPVVALDWGIAAQVDYLTAGRVAPVEVFGYGATAGPDFAVQVGPFLGQPGARFVLHSPQEAVFDRRDAFNALAEPHGGTRRDAIVSRRDGGPVFEIRVVRGP